MTHRIRALLAIAFAASLLALAGCGDDEPTDTTAGDTTEQTGETADTGATEETPDEDSVQTGTECGEADQPAEKDVRLDKPKRRLDKSKKHTVVFQTNCGSFTVTLDAKRNPKTAASVAHIAREKLYDGTWFHRIVPGFVIQGGDPMGVGQGGAGYQVVEEPNGDYEIGTIAMAKTGAEPAGTSSSQFFVIIGDQGVALPPDYAIAGKVTKGMDAVERIAELSTPGSESPSGVALIEKATYSAK